MVRYVGHRASFVKSRALAGISDMKADVISGHLDISDIEL
jgi:hypothetical protein